MTVRRASLGNVLAKLREGQPVNIAYLGGFITAAAGWRVKTREWFSREFPEAQVNEIHAAIGGTDICFVQIYTEIVADAKSLPIDSYESVASRPHLLSTRLTSRLQSQAKTKFSKNKRLLGPVF